MFSSAKAGSFLVAAGMVLSLVIAACTVGVGDVSPRGEYEAAARYGWGGEYVVRWPISTVEVYDRDGISGLERVLEKWNEALQEHIRYKLSDNPRAPVQVLYDDFLFEREGYCGLAIVWVDEGYSLDRAEVRISPDPSCGDLFSLLLHEFGHISGFRGHTSDGGVMDSPPGDAVISPLVREALEVLYTFPPGSLIPGVSLAPVEVSGLWGGHITSSAGKEEIAFTLSREGTQVMGTFTLADKKGMVEGELSGEVWYFELGNEEKECSTKAHGIANILDGSILFTFTGSICGLEYPDGFGRVNRL